MIAVMLANQGAQLKASRALQQQVMMEEKVDQLLKHYDGWPPINLKGSRMTTHFNISNFTRFQNYLNG